MDVHRRDVRADAIELALIEAGIAADVRELRAAVAASTSMQVLGAATLKAPEAAFMQQGGKRGAHTEHFGHLLAEMQVLPRAHPGARW